VNPYKANDPDAIKTFGEIDSQIREKYSKVQQQLSAEIDPDVRQPLQDFISVFNYFHYEPAQLHEEIIVRYFQFLAYGKDNLKQYMDVLKQYAPKLYDYVKNVYMAACIKYLQDNDYTKHLNVDFESTTSSSSAPEEPHLDANTPTVSMP